MSTIMRAPENFAGKTATYVAAAHAASAVLRSRLIVVYAIVTLSSGILVIGLVMWRGGFGWIAARLRVMTGVLGIASLAGMAVTIILNAVAATVWLFLVGYRLYRLGKG